MVFRVEESDGIPSFSGEKDVVKASENNFTGMINESDAVDVFKIERYSNAGYFFFIINCAVPKVYKGVKVEGGMEVEYANNVNDVGLNIEAGFKPVNVFVVVK